MTDYPSAIDFPAHPTNVLGPPENVPKGWVLHTPEEPADGIMGTPSWFARPNIGGSTTYFVSYLGFVVQCVPENVGAIANGVTPPLPYPAWANKNVSLNRQTLSVEIEGYAATIANTISPAQKTALLNLLRHRCEAYGIPIDRQHIIGHYEVANNRSDPGTLNIDAIVAELQEDDMDTTQDTRLREIHQALTFPVKLFWDRSKTIPAWQAMLVVYNILTDDVDPGTLDVPRFAAWASELTKAAAPNPQAIADAKAFVAELGRELQD